jgi:hypothetical protein
MNEAESLRHLVGHTRQLTLAMLKKLEGADVRKRFEVDGRKLNSVYWLTAHMAWAQNNLILRSTGGPNPEVKWLKFFALGKPAEEGETNGPSWEEVLAGFHKVHEFSMIQLEQLDPALLDSPNKIDWEIMGGKTMRNTIMHHIRHENNHAGQLFWLVNFHGGKTI